MITCQKCGQVYRNDSPKYTYPAYHFSSASFPKGSYVTPEDIEDAGEDMLTCPHDPGPAPLDASGDPEYPTGSTPSGGNMHEGDSRYTSGDETHPSKEDL